MHRLLAPAPRASAARPRPLAILFAFYSHLCIRAPAGDAPKQPAAAKKPTPAAPAAIAKALTKLQGEHDALVTKHAKLEQALTTKGARITALEKEKSGLEVAKVRAEAKLESLQVEHDALTQTSEKDVTIAVMKAKMEAGFLMLQRAEGRTAATAGSAGGATATPGAAGSADALPTPTALEQFFRHEGVRTKE